MNSSSVFNYHLATSVTMQVPLIAHGGFSDALTSPFPKTCYSVLEVVFPDPELEWRQRTARCQSKARFVCLFGNKGGNTNSKDAARRALENALGGKKDAFERWDEEIKKREAAGSGGGSGGRGWFGGPGDGDSWKETQQALFAIAGLIFLYLVLVKGKSVMAFAVNSLVFLLRGFRNGFRSISSVGSRTSSPSISSFNTGPKALDGTPGSAQANVIRKWGPE